MAKGYPTLAERISPDYLDQQRALHAAPRGYGGGGHKWACFVSALIADEGHARVLDYGCGQGTLRERLLKLAPHCHIANYDPAVEEWSTEPASADLLVCTDVLEHIEPDRLDMVLEHTVALADRQAFFVISLKPANKTLPDGRNAHLIIESPGWWVVRLGAFFSIEAHWPNGRDRDELCVVARKKPVGRP